MLGDFDGSHTRRWLRIFIERGHEVHAISFYRPRSELAGVTLHMLRPERRNVTAEGAMPHRDLGRRPATAAIRRELARRAPPAWQRWVQALRYARAGLRRVLGEIAPNVFHAHYVVEHGFYGSFAAFHPYVVSAWGSDLYQAPKTAAGRIIARRALRAADLLTVNDPALGQRAIALGVLPERMALVRLGVEPEYLERPLLSVNLATAGGPPTVISDRALEPLYNVDVVVRAFSRLREQVPAARLLIAGEGSERTRLETLTRELGQDGPIRFLGHLDQAALRRLLGEAHVYVSVPSSDSLSSSTMEAMACGAFPVVSDLPSQNGWITHRLNGLRVPVRDVGALADCLVEALTDAGARRAAVGPNRARVEAEGSLEANMLLMERHYYRLAGRPLTEGF